MTTSGAVGSPFVVDIRLAEDPKGTATVMLAPQDPSGLTLGTTQLSFNASDWNQDKQVTATIRKDVPQIVNVEITTSWGGVDNVRKQQITLTPTTIPDFTVSQSNTILTPTANSMFPQYTKLGEFYVPPDHPADVWVSVYAEAGRDWSTTSKSLGLFFTNSEGDVVQTTGTFADSGGEVAFSTVKVYDANSGSAALQRGGLLEVWGTAFWGSLQTTLEGPYTKSVSLRFECNSETSYLNITEIAFVQQQTNATVSTSDYGELEGDHNFPIQFDVEHDQGPFYHTSLHKITVSSSDNTTAPGGTGVSGTVTAHAAVVSGETISFRFSGTVTFGVSHSQGLNFSAPTTITAELEQNGSYPPSTHSVDSFGLTGTVQWSLTHIH